MMKEFYAYIHRRPDGSAFYVGKGCGRRAFDMCSRNQHHKRIVAKIGKENVNIEVLPAESESHALALEAALIKIMKRHGYSIANMTNGGEQGPNGYKHTPEAKERIRQSSVGRKHMAGKKPSIESVDKNRAAALVQWEKIRVGEIAPPKRIGRRGERTTAEHRRELKNISQRKRRAIAKSLVTNLQTNKG